MRDRFLPRHASRRLLAAMSAMPVVVVMGARQTGKSTLVRRLPELQQRTYLTLDDFDTLAEAHSDPMHLIERAQRLTLDEVQREADLVLAIKQAVDEDRRPGRFVLTGSANLLLMQRISESLAGRASYVPLWPMTRREQLGLGTAGIWSDLLSADPATWPHRLEAQDVPAEDWAALARRGGYPTVAHELDSDEARSIWFEGYLRTYLERDLQDLASIDRLVDFRRLMRVAALRTGAVVNQADMARDAGLSRPTTHRYLNLLEASFQVVRVEPYAVNRTKRLIKSPKLYWSDPGLGLHLSGGTPGGAHLENVVLADLLAWRDGTLAPAEILFWRTVNGEEVDFVVETPDRLLPIEVKATDRPRARDALHLETFLATHGDRAPAALLLHCGDEVGWVRRGVLGAPWWTVL